jgi:hypothetical protein
MPTITQDELARELTTKYVLDDQSADGLMPSARILAAKYGVSRLFLREVLAGMQRQGLIKAVPGKGVFIRIYQLVYSGFNYHARCTYIAYIYIYIYRYIISYEKRILIR